MDYIRSKNVLKYKVNNIPELKDIGEVLFLLSTNLNRTQSILTDITILLGIGSQTKLLLMFSKIICHITLMNPRTKWLKSPDFFHLF